MDSWLFLPVALLLGLAAGWFGSLKWGRSPEPLDAAAVDRRLRNLFDQLSNNTTQVVTGLQEDIQGLRQHIDLISAWGPGRELESPAQLSRWIVEITAKIEAMHQAHRRRRLFDYGMALGVSFIVGRILWNIIVGPS